MEFAEDENADVGLFDEVDGVGELGVALGVGRHFGLFAVELAIKDRGLFAFDLDAGSVGDCGCAEALAQAVQDGDGVGGMAGEAPRAHDVRLGIGEGADEGNGFGGGCERKDAAFVAQQDGDAGAGGARGFALLRRDHERGGFGWVGVGVLEEAETPLGHEDVVHGGIDL